MSSAIAALAGASIGALAALAGQYLAHRLAVHRDNAMEVRALIHEGVAAMRQTLLFTELTLAAELGADRPPPPRRVPEVPAHDRPRGPRRLAGPSDPRQLRHPQARQRQEWLAKHPRFVLHFIPTSTSWLNMVERWFGKLDDKAIRRGVFKSVPDLIAAIETYLSANNTNPKPFIWTTTADSILAKVRRGRVTLDATTNQNRDAALGDAGPSRRLKVVVVFEGSTSRRIITAFPRRRRP